MIAICGAANAAPEPTGVVLEFKQEIERDYPELYARMQQLETSNDPRDKALAADLMRAQVRDATLAAPDAPLAELARFILVELRQAARTSSRACVAAGVRPGAGGNPATADRQLQLTIAVLTAAAHDHVPGRPRLSSQEVDDAYAAAIVALSRTDQDAFATLQGPPTTDAQFAAVCHWMIKLREGVNGKGDAEVAALVRGLAARQ